MVEDVTIREIAETIAEVIGFSGVTEWDTSKPNGTLQKLLDVANLVEVGWTARISLRGGLESTIDWYREHAAEVRQ